MVLRSKPRSLRLASLALPFIFTAGCSSTPKPQPEAPRPWRDEAGTCYIMPEVNCPPPEEATCNPPPPEIVVCPMDPAQLSHDAYRPPPPARRIGRDDNGKCWEEIDVKCDPPEEGSTCNPPEPREIACPTDATELRYDHFKPALPAIEMPTANPPAPDRVAVPVVAAPTPVRRDGAGQCWTVPKDTCEGVDHPCNPPPPAPTECPADPKSLISDDYKPLPKATLGRVYQRPDGQCFEQIEPNCPPPVNGIHTSCNPPPPRKVECPPDLIKPTKDLVP